MKNKYETPNIEYIEINREIDVLTSSTSDIQGDDNDVNFGD